MKFNWPESAIAMLRKMAAEKYSCGDAAAALSATYRADVTRNAVVGKANRLGIVFNSHSPNNHKAGRDYKTKARKEAVVSVAPIVVENVALAIAEPAIDLVEESPEIEEIAIEEIALPVSGRVTLFELRDNTCRWPIGAPGADDFHFCGAGGASLAAGRPYCAEHLAAARSREFTKAERAKYIADKKREVARHGR